MFRISAILLLAGTGASCAFDAASPPPLVDRGIRLGVSRALAGEADLATQESPPRPAAKSEFTSPHGLLVGFEGEYQNGWILHLGTRLLSLDWESETGARGDDDALEFELGVRHHFFDRASDAPFTPFVGIDTWIIPSVDLGLSEDVLCSGFGLSAGVAMRIDETWMLDLRYRFLTGGTGGEYTSGSIDSHQLELGLVYWLGMPDARSDG